MSDFKNRDKFSSHSSSKVLESYRIKYEDDAFSIRDVKTGISAKIDESKSAIKHMASGNIKNIAYSVTEFEDYSVRKELNKVKDVKTVTDGTFAVITSTPRALGKVGDISKTAGSTFKSGYHYIKGERVPIYHSDAVRGARSQRVYMGKTHGEMMSFKESSINKRISVLAVKRNLTDKEKELYKKMINLKKDEFTLNRYYKGEKRIKAVSKIAERKANKSMEESETLGASELIATQEFVRNRYVKSVAKDAGRLFYGAGKAVANVGGKVAVGAVKGTVKGLGIDQTGFGRSVAEGYKSTVSAAKDGKDFIKGEIHGGIYRRTQKYLDKSERYQRYRAFKASKVSTLKGYGSHIKKGADYLKSTTAGGYVGAAIKAIQTVAAAIRNGTDLVSTAVNLVKTIVFAVVGAFLMKAVIISMAVFMVFTSFFFWLSMDKNEVPFYVSHIEAMEEDLMNTIEKEVEKMVIQNRGDIDKTVYNYTGKFGLSITKEILSMTAAYNNQDWPKYNQLFNHENPTKAYIEHLFKIGITYNIEPGPAYECPDGCDIEEREVCHVVLDDDGLEVEDCKIESVRICHLHRDVIVTIHTRNLDELILADINNPMETEYDGFSGWDDGFIEMAHTIYDQDWYEAYGVLTGGGGGNTTPLTREEINAILATLPEDLSPERRKVIESAISGVGIIKYYLHWRNYINPLRPGIENNPFGQPAPPYGSGNHTILGLDCSGFIVWAFMTAGYPPETIGWGYADTARIYSTYGTTEISRSELQPGDLGLIRKTGSSEKNNDYNHVGIYIGNNTWVHSSGGQGANVAVLDYFRVFVRVNVLD